jgi:glycosyltransferase involved in cell wall biosynthesis
MDCCSQKTTLRVGVDASVYAGVRAGIARYLTCMVSEMMALDSHVEFVLYSPGYVHVPLPNGRWRLRTGPGRHHERLNLWVQRQIPEWAAEDKLDVFWGQNHGLPLRLRHSCLRLLTVHDLAPLVCPGSMVLRTAIARRFYMPRACRVADAIVADSDSTARQIVQLLGVRRDRITRVYLGVDSRFQPMPVSVTRTRVAEKYGLTGEYLLTVGTIEPRKDHLVLLRALRESPDAPMLVIVGEVGWKARTLVAEISAMERAGRVRRLGFVDDADLPDLYGAASMVVFPSRYEGFGLPVLEAMACGCPVLCSWSSSLPELGGVAARYFRVGDSADLAGKLKALLSDEKQRAAMSAAGVVRARQFSFRQAARAVLGIVRRGVEGGS